MNPKPIDPSTMADSPLTGGGPPTSNAEGSSVRWCATCKQWLPHTKFKITKTKPRGGQCLNCVREARLAISIRSARKHAERKRAYEKKYRQRNKKKLQAANNKWRDKNRARINKLARERRQRDPKKYDARQKRWRERNRAKIKAYSAAYHKAHAEQKAKQTAKWVAANHKKVRLTSQKWRQAHSERVKYYRNKRRALKANAPCPAINCPQNIMARWVMWGNRCYICGSQATASDHVIALIRGGPHCLSNMRPICKSCNSAKKDKLLAQFILERLQKGKLIWKQPIPRLP